MTQEPEPIAMDAPMQPARQLPITERLALRCFTPDDLDMLDRMNSDEEVMRYVGGVKDRAKTEEMLKVRILAYYEQHPGLGVWATLERASGACVGMHLLNHIQGESFIQVGYVLFRDYWGRGYATEMSCALLRYGFKSLRLPQIVAITNLPNEASQRVLLKAGLHRNGERSFAHQAYADQGPLAWFERDAADWLAENPADAGVQPASGSATHG
jgi:ribosomal-protein-alanine N-acetyltransferase